LYVIIKTNLITHHDQEQKQFDPATMSITYPLTNNTFMI